MTSTAIPPELKTEAARSLIERLLEKTALVRLFRFNAAMKHGVPIKDREITVQPTQEIVKEVVREHQSPAQQPQQSRQAQQAQPQPQQTVSPASSQSAGDAWWKSLVLPASLLGAGTLAAAGGYLAGTGNSSDKQSAPAEAGVVVRETMHESPLQYIEDQGGHLP